MCPAELSDADLVWNRATEPERVHGRPGDAALAAILLVDGQIMNGGIESALEYIEPSRYAAAADGYAFVGLDDLAATLRSATTLFSGGAPPADSEVLGVGSVVGLEAVEQEPISCRHVAVLELFEAVLGRVVHRSIRARAAGP